MSSERPAPSEADLLASIERYCERVAIPTLFRLACPNLWAESQRRAAATATENPTPRRAS